jgi:hypothetical protein
MLKQNKTPSTLANPIQQHIKKIHAGHQWLTPVNWSYSGWRDQEDCGSKASLDKQFVWSYIENTVGIAQRENTCLTCVRPSVLTSQKPPKCSAKVLSSIPYLENTQHKKRAGRVAQVIECTPSKGEALSSSPDLTHTHTHTHTQIQKRARGVAQVVE